jgi:hypothetical protein
MNKSVNDIAAFISRFADRFRNAKQVDAERQARFAAKAILLANDTEIAETIRGLLVRRWMAHAILPGAGGAPHGGGGGGGGSEYEPPDDSSTTLLNKINSVIAQPDVQPGYPDANGKTKTTWCNRAAYRIVTDMDYDMSAVLTRNRDTGEPDINWTTANDLAKQAAKASKEPNSGVIEILTAEEARNLANSGVPVLAAADNPNPKRSGHVAVLAPSQANVTMVGQAGSKMGVMPLNSGFSRLSNRVHFYRFPRVGN